MIPKRTKRPGIDQSIRRGKQQQEKCPVSVVLGGRSAAFQTLNEGFTVHDYRRRTGLDMDSVEAKLAEGEGRGLLAGRGGVWRPTELGRRFLNDLQASFLA